MIENSLRHLIFATLIVSFFAANALAGTDQVGAAGANAQGSFHSVPPQESEYWSYVHDYMETASVSLLVSGRDQTHLVTALEEVKELKRLGVLVNKVAITNRSVMSEVHLGGVLNIAALDPRNPKGSLKQKGIARSRIGELSQELGLQGGQVEDLKELTAKYEVRHSPTWLIKFRGRVLVFEGERSPSKLFIRGGSLREDLKAMQNLHRRTASGEDLYNSENSRDPSVTSFNAFSAALKSAAQVFSLPQEQVAVIPEEYDGLGACAEKQVIRAPVHSGGGSSLNLDLLVYDYFDSNQRDAASQYPRPLVAYVPGDLSNPSRNFTDSLPQIARLLKPRCLPTRVRYVRTGENEYFEYREGSIAWEDTN